jgi:hypothetical protein
MEGTPPHKYLAFYDLGADPAARLDALQHVANANEFSPSFIDLRVAVRRNETA